MRKVVQVLASAIAMLMLIGLTTIPAYGQGGTTSTLSGIAVDSSGAVLPGADVTIKHLATGADPNGRHQRRRRVLVPGMNVGTYTRDRHAPGFKTFVVEQRRADVGRRRQRHARRSKSAASREQVVVSSASEIVQTQSTTVSSTINTNQITKLPLTSRSAMDFVNFLPGVSTPGGNRDATINGLPQRRRSTSRSTA